MGAIDRDDVHVREHLIEALPIGRLETAFKLGMDAPAVVIVDRQAEAARAAGERRADPAHADDAQSLAAEAMAGFPAELAPARVAKVISAWAATEPTRASAFIADRMGPSPARDAAVVALVDQINRASPAKAAEWVQSISDPELRDAVRNSLSN